MDLEELSEAVDLDREVRWVAAEKVVVAQEAVDSDLAV